MWEIRGSNPLVLAITPWLSGRAPQNILDDFLSAVLSRETGIDQKR